MSAAVPDDVAAMLEFGRAHRAALTRTLPLAPDSLHRVLRCTRCAQWNIDTRVYQGFLQVADGGARPCWNLQELLDFATTQHLALHRSDRLDACRCGAPAVCLSLAGARFFHAMPGSGAELFVEVLYAEDRVASVRVGRAVGGGPAVLLDELSEAAIHGVFGVPLTVWEPWRAVVAADEGGLVAIEEGLAFAAFPATSEAFRAELDEALGAEPELRAYGLSPRVAADPSWQWLRSDPNLARRPDTVLVSMIRHDVLASRVALLAASRGMGTRRDADTVWVEDGLARWPVELPTVAEEGLRRGFSLSTMAAAALSQALERLETLKTFFGAIEKLRPGVTLSVDGMLLKPSVEGVAGRPLDLRVAPFGGIPDPETLDRDLRFHLGEAPAWSDPWRVCPCGAARSVALHRRRRDDLIALGVAAGDLVELDEAGVEADPDIVRVLSVACDRHAEYALRPLRATHPQTLEWLQGQMERDLDRQRFSIRVAPHADVDGRVAALVEGARLLDATAHPSLVAGLVREVLGSAVAASIATISRDLAVVYDAASSPDLVASLVEAAGVLRTVERGTPPIPARVRVVLDASAAPRGIFERTEIAPAAEP